MVLLTWNQGFGAQEGDVVICEIMPDPDSVADTYGEWFEVYNNSGTAVNLLDWTIADLGTNRHTIVTDLIIPDQSVAVLARNGNVSLNGGVEVDYVYSSFTLSNSTDEIIIEDDLGREIDRVEYVGSWPFSSGHSMTLKVGDPNQDNNSASSWQQESTVTYGSGDYGTPGTIGGDQSLPVTLISFTAKVTKEEIILNWETECEIDNLGFYVLRSESDKNSYSALSSLIAGAGTTIIPQHYQFVDRHVTKGKSYWYKLQQIDFTGVSKFFGPLQIYFDGTEVTSGDTGLPEKTTLLGNYPNPFNPNTLISFFLNNDQVVTLSILTVTGEKAKTLIKNKLSSGYHQVVWDGTDDQGNLLPGGVYFCQMYSADKDFHSIKLVKVH